MTPGFINPGFVSEHKHGARPKVQTTRLPTEEVAVRVEVQERSSGANQPLFLQTENTDPAPSLTIQSAEQQPNTEQTSSNAPDPSLPVLSSPSDNLPHEAVQQTPMSVSVEVTEDSNDSEPPPPYPVVHEPVPSAPSNNTTQEAAQHIALTMDDPRHSFVPDNVAHEADQLTGMPVEVSEDSDEYIPPPPYPCPETMPSAPSDNMTQEAAQQPELPEYWDDYVPPPPYPYVPAPVSSAPSDNTTHQTVQQTAMPASVEVTQDSDDDQPPPPLPRRSSSVKLPKYINMNAAVNSEDGQSPRRRSVTSPLGQKRRKLLLLLEQKRKEDAIRSREADHQDTDGDDWRVCLWCGSVVRV